MLAYTQFGNQLLLCVASAVKYENKCVISVKRLYRVDAYTEIDSVGIAKKLHLPKSNKDGIYNKFLLTTEQTIMG